MIIDFHAHAFPDELAPKALKKLAYKSHVKPSFDGTVSGLLKSMDKAGIEKSVLLNIATRPEQTEKIIAWCLGIKSERIIPFASIHPENKNIGALAGRIKGEGLPGVKLHPMYQDFSMDEERLFPLYEALRKEGLLLLLHTGFAEGKRAEMKRLKNIIIRFPGLRIIASHTGGWKMWAEVLDVIAGSDIWLEISMTMKYIEDMGLFFEILEKHSGDKILFGTDAPWAGQKEEALNFKKLNLGKEIEDRIFYKNALALLASV